ncbi:flavin-containing amine oxidase [Niveomyces insectorum RCEF 264]|uniref:Amine oxidase n=1 Tax=Niveomyces insectorum RCEF 264 TaxID=1081102 RepID=A0A167T771_9HYPO|nr:flavin-containing amine oxidase [Niveomyces insectorum RCEF 264]
MPETVDVEVAIIGAGLSGLQAALDVHKAGRSFLILEARDRVGGKTLTVARPDGRGNQELGPAWINDSNQSRVWAYVHRFGLTPVTQNIQGTVACEDADGSRHSFPYGGLPEFGESAKANIAMIRDKIEAMSHDPATFQQPRRSELDSQSLEQFVRASGGGERAVQTVRLWSHGMFGQEPWEISALGFLEVARGGCGIANIRSDGQHGAQYLRLKEGTSAISRGLVGLLPAGAVRLNAPVAAVVKTKGTGGPGSCYYTLTAPGGTVRAKKVIVGVPGTTYKNIHFDPPLPPVQSVYTTSTRYGLYVKFLLLFSTPFWRAKGACGLAQSFRGPVSIVRDTSNDDEGNFALTCFISAAPGRRWYALNTQDRETAVLAQMSRLFETPLADVQAAFVGSLTSPWMEDRWAGCGCPFSMPPPGALSATSDGQLATEGFEGLVFVGTEFTDHWRGYMEGALESGERGATKALAGLSRTTKL